MKTRKGKQGQFEKKRRSEIPFVRIEGREPSPQNSRIKIEGH